MKKFLVLVFSLFSLVLSRAASPAYESFEPTQFSTNNGFISIKDGAVITNLNVITDLFINSTNIVNLFAPSSVTNSGDSLWFDVASEATLTNTMESMVFFHDLNAGDDDSIALDYFVTTDQNFTNYAGLYAPFTSTSSSIQSYTIFGNGGPTEENRVQLSTDATSASIQMLFNGVLTDGFNVATPSGYTGGGTLFLSDDGTYKSSVTINPTDGYVPYRSNATTFGDSPWYRITTNSVGFNFTNRFVTAPGDTSLPNLFVGIDSGNLTTSGSFNIGVGKNVLKAVTSGLQNVAVGDSSMDVLTTGVSNVGMGVNSLGSLVANDGNTAIGHSVFNLLLGKNATAIGSNAGIHVTNAEHSVIGGFRAGYYQTNLHESVVIGGLAQTNTAEGSFQNIIAIGFRANATNDNEIVIGNTSNTKAIFPITSYTGAGTLFLSDDGTYKSAGGVGGDSIWTNITGYVTMIPGQTATNTLAFTSGAADNATNILLKVDSANYLSASGSLLASFGNAGTNKVTVAHNGVVAIRDLPNMGIGGDSDSSLIIARDVGIDGFAMARQVWYYSDTDGDEVIIKAQSTDDSSMIQGYINSQDTWELGNTKALGSYLSLSVDSDVRTLLFPGVASSGSAVAYEFDTSNTLTNGDKFVSIGNAGTEVLNISPNSTGAQIVFGPGTTNVLSRSGSDLVYTNGSLGSVELSIRGGASATKFATIGVSSSGNTTIGANTAGQSIQFTQADSTGNLNIFNNAFTPSANNTWDLGAATSNGRWKNIHLDGNIVWNGETNTLFDTWGIATPEGSKAARPGSVFRNTADAGVLSVKTDGTGNTGWQPVHVGNQAYLAANGTVSDATLVNLSLSVGVTSGKKYAFRCVLYCANSTAGDGVKIDFDGGSAAATNFRAHTKITDAALLTSTQTSALATDITAATITGDTEIEVNGSFEPSGTGTLIPRFAENSDGGGTLTVYRGSHLILTEIP